jgi:hypothetical protein
VRTSKKAKRQRNCETTQSRNQTYKEKTAANQTSEVKLPLPEKESRPNVIQLNDYVIINETQTVGQVTALQAMMWWFLLMPSILELPSTS